MIDAHLLIPNSSDSPAQQLDVEILAAYLRREGFGVSLCDLSLVAGGGRGLIEKIARVPARFLYWHLPTARAFPVLDRLWREEDLPKSLGWEPVAVLAGGYFATHFAAEVLERAPFLSAIVRGELERPMHWLLQPGLGRSWRDMPSARVRLEKGGRSRQNPPPTQGPMALDRLPAAATDLFHENRRRGGQTILVGRGCESFCRYCGYGPYFRAAFGDGRKLWRSRSASEIVDEIETFQEKHRVDRFLFQAAVFFGYDERGTKAVESLCHEILNRALDIRFKIVSHPGHLVRNAGLLPLLKRSGLELVYLGVDSGAEASLRRFDVEFGVDESLKAFKLLNSLQIDLTPGFIFYEPYMTPEDLEKQFRFLDRVRPFFDHMKATYPYFLDRFLLGQALEVKTFMPMSEELRQDDLLERKDGEVPWASPRVRFENPRVGAFFRIHRTVHREILVELRPLLWNHRCVESFPSLETLPLEILNTLRRRFFEERSLTEASAVAAALDLARQRTNDDLNKMFELISLSPERRERVLSLLRP